MSSTKRSQKTYAKLLRRVDPRSRSPFGWHGRYFVPGKIIRESELWPDDTYPRVPLLLEFAGAENPQRGHNRHKCDETVVLWRYDRERAEFDQLGRVAAPGAMWAMLLEPLVREAMLRELGFVHAPDIEAIRSRLARVIDAEFDRLEDGDRARVLTLIHDELACRLAEAGSGSQPVSRPGWPVGTQNGLTV